MVLKFDGTDFELLTSQSTGLHSNGIRDILVDGWGRVWFVTFSASPSLIPAAARLSRLCCRGSNMSVYPNPGLLPVSLQWKAPVSGEYTIDLYDPQGRLLQKLWSGQREVGDHSLDIARGELPQGYYLIRLLGPDKQEAVPLILR